MSSFITVFTKHLSKIWRKKCHISTQKFMIHFSMYVLLRHHVFLYLKFYVLFYFCHHSLFNVSLLYLFINVFTRYLSKPWWKKCHILTQNSNIQFNMYLSLHHHMLLYLTFVYLSIPSSLLVEGTANTWWILLHNDRTSRHRRIKKQHRYKRLRCNTSLIIPVGYGRVRQRPGDGFFIKFNMWKPSENNNKTSLLFAFCIILIGPSF